MHLLDTITELSHEFGRDSYVRGGGGNTSCKDATTLWIKPSGTTLAGLTPGAFLAMDRARLARLETLQPPADAAAREAQVLAEMLAAVSPATPGRPSVEAPLHNLFRARYVVHTHPARVNGLTCSLGAAAAAASLFPEALWMPYCDPGFTLCLRAREALADHRRRHGRDPEMLLLESHGVFVAGDTPEAIRATYARLLARLDAAYAAAGIDPLPARGPEPAAAAVAEVGARLAAALGAEGAHLAASAPFAYVSGPVSPDHIVYARSFPYEGALTPEALQGYLARHGRAPRVVATASGIYGVAASAAAAARALEFAWDAAQVRAAARAFGGIRYLPDASRLFIEEWEVESYRAKQAG